MARDGRPRHVGEALGEFFRRSGMVRSLKRVEAVLLWPRVAGPEVARFSSARALRGGVLYVDVSDSETAMHLSMQRRRFLAVFHERYQAHEVKDVRFQAGRPALRDEGASSRSRRAQGDAAAAGSETDAPEADELALARLARELAELDLTEDVSSALLTAGRSLLALHARQRAAGYAECPTCGALHPGPLEPLTLQEAALAGRDKSGYDLPDRELCAACRRHAAEPGVKAASSALALEPSSATPRLTDAQRGVALRLAAAALEAQLRSAFVAALADPAARRTLESLARRRVLVGTAQATLGMPGAPSGDPDDVLDARYRRFLDLDGDTRT